MGTTGQSITLANSIIGVGILAMPFCFQQCGVLLATLILLFMGLVSRLCCHFLLKSALLARRRNFEFLAFHVFGQAGKLAVEIGIIGFLMGTCIAYFVVVGDLGPQIVAKMFNINQSDILRTSIMVIVSLVCVLPLGLLRNVDSLSNVSAATIAFYFCLVMKVIFEAGGVMMTSDWNQRVETWRPAGLLQCVPIFSMALFCQTQLFEIFESLPSLSLEKMNIVTKNAINICTAVYFTLGVFGYIAFSAHQISGNILVSLSPTMASDVIKLGFVMSLAFSFPLIIFPCRASLYSFLYKKVHSSHHDHIINHSIPETTFRCITVAIVAVALFISLLIPNIELVLGLVGSTIGVLICVVFPAACFIGVTFKNTNERVLAKGVLVLGLVIMVLGTYANLRVAESSIEHYDDKYTQERIDKIVEDFFESRNKDDVFLKPPPSNDIQKEPPDDVIVNKDKDSEVQPPNPVPPESHSNEKMTLTKNAMQTEEKDQQKDILQVPETKKAEDKVSESHPRNLKNKLELKLANGVNNGEAPKPKEEKPPSNEDKIVLIKQQKLIETIKQHGEEQKELIKEQKEILDEILKTKKELQQNKNEAVEANEAKKLAVESIKQIADMAIKSIGGVSETPDIVKKDEKAEERLEKITNDAVQEIAKKAVETIEAIQDIKEKPEPNAVPPVQNNLPNAQENPAQNEQPKQNVQPEILVNAPIPEVANPPVVRTKDEAPNNLPVNVIPQANNSPNLVNAVVVQNVENNVIQNNATVAQNNIVPNANPQPAEAKPVANVVPNDNAQISQNNVQNPPEVAKVPSNPVIDAIKPHSHSPDEPQSYQQGEDTQEVRPETKPFVQNVPLPIVNELANNQIKIDKKPAAQTQNDDIQVNVPPKVESNGANNANLQESLPVANAQAQSNPAPVRQKREVIDCTDKVSLKPEDEAICRNLVDENVKDSEVKLNSASQAQKQKENKQQYNKDKYIKQYEEKQRELTKEHKDVQDETLKSIKQTEQNEAVANEAKKMAVESIKQIADKAFVKIGGLSEKPNQAKKDMKIEERVEKLTNEAVQETPKKIVEQSVSNGETQNSKEQTNENNMVMMKEQKLAKLIKAVKLYGEVQKEMTKEQKEILDEIVQAKEAGKGIKSVQDMNDANNAKIRENVPIAKPENINPVPIEHREVIDCTEKVSLKPKDKAICRNKLDENLKDSEKILPIPMKNVDLNEIVLPKSLPIAANILHHISRQLKSFDKDER